ncbi:MAG: YbaN family protein [Solimonas sp.]
MTPADGSRATDAAGTRPLRSPLARAALLLLAALCVATGVIGIFVPGLPTTVFILIAGWAAARSSPRFSAWLWSHRLFGPMLKNWHETRSVSRRVKWTATLTMSLSAALLFAAPLRPLLAGGICGLMLAVLIWLWCLPEPARLGG